MSTIKEQFRGEHSINTGIEKVFEFNIADSQGYPGGTIELDVLGYTKASIQIITTGATGIAGSFSIKQGNVSGTGFNFSTPISIASGSDINSFQGDIDVTATYLILDTAGISSWGTVGKVKVILVAKR